MKIELIFRHKWMRKFFQKRAGELSYVYGRDVVINSVRRFCYHKILHDDLVHQAELQKELEEANGQGTN